MLKRRTYQLAFFGSVRFPVTWLLLFITPANAQFTLQVRLDSFPQTHPHDSLFIAGTFNRWEPGNSQYRFEKSGDKHTVLIPGLSKGSYEFKITRGNWKNCESGQMGTGMDNRKLMLLSDTTIDISIASWSDDYGASEVKHTASSSVGVLDSAFFIPQLNRYRKIWIYLPPGYEKAKKRYPVLYMQDGQNLFDDATSFSGEWGVDECLDSLNKAGISTGIVVGVENSPERLREYAPFATDEITNPEGKAYASFLVNTLKPYIDKHYRTLPGKENSMVAGSSFGANISYFCMLQYPQVFGKGGLFSLSLRLMPPLISLTDSMAPKLNSQFFFYTGGQESETMVSNTQNIADKLGEYSNGLVYHINDPSGKHDEKAWRKWFAECYLWMMGNGFSHQVKPSD